MNETIETYIQDIDRDTEDKYLEYFGSLRPTNDEDFFRMFLFSFASVHSSWQNNIRTYVFLKDISWIEKESRLKNRLSVSSGGMENNRAKYLWEFSKKFWDCPSRYKKKMHASWQAYRLRLIKDIKGLGPAKTSFSVELCYPESAQVVCLDRHMLKLYKHPKETCSLSDYVSYEDHWIGQCSETSCSPVMARFIWWDKLQGYGDSRYWSYCLEEK